jgi:hypothetical protein
MKPPKIIILAMVAGAFALIVCGIVWYRATAHRLAEKLAFLENSYAKQQVELSRVTSRLIALQTKIASTESQRQTAASSAARDESVRAPGTGFDAKKVLLSPEQALRLSKLRHQYGDFIKQRGMGGADAEQLLSVLAEREALNSDVQTQIREQSLTDTASVEALREQLQNPISKAIESMLGYQGAQELSSYERKTFYREAYVAPLVQELGSGIVPLTADQISHLTDLVLKNDHPYKKDASDVAMESRVDWAEVLAGASQFLTPSQIAALQKSAARMGSSH